MNGKTMVQSRMMMNQCLIENEKKKNQIRSHEGRTKLTGLGVSFI